MRMNHPAAMLGGPASSYKAQEMPGWRVGLRPAALLLSGINNPSPGRSISHPATSEHFSEGEDQSLPPSGSGCSDSTWNNQTSLQFSCVLSQPQLCSRLTPANQICHPCSSKLDGFTVSTCPWLASLPAHQSLVVLLHFTKELPRSASARCISMTGNVISAVRWSYSPAAVKAVFSLSWFDIKWKGLQEQMCIEAAPNNPGHSPESHGASTQRANARYNASPAPESLPGQAVLLSRTPQGIHLHALNVGGGLNVVRIWDQVRQAWKEKEGWCVSQAGREVHRNSPIQPGSSSLPASTTGHNNMNGLTESSFVL